VAGEVPIDVSPVAGDPRATIDKMQQVRAAALAPAEPSGADRRIAAEAQQTLAQAQAELVQQMAQASDGRAAGNAAADPWFIADDSDIDTDPWALPGSDLGISPQADEANAGEWGTAGQPMVNQPAAASAGISVSTVTPRVLENADLMQRRNAVISQFYRNAVEASERPLRLTA
jgi:hypothetical protein